MAISLKKSNANPTSTTLSTQQNQNTHRSNKYFYFTICVLSIMFTLIVFFHQLNSSYAILDYIDAYGKVPEKSSMSDVLGNDGGDKMQPSLVKKPSSDFTVKAVSILGERNSGTNWIYDHLNECFNHTMPIERKLKRYKHWFQDENVGEPIELGTLVVALFRNPFEWVEAMRKKPHHAPAHMFIKDWREFVSKPWTMKRVGKDLNMSIEERSKKNACQENFMYKDIISCYTRPYPEDYFNKTHYSEHQPFYEMRNDGSGQPFDNILEMRAAKIRNFLATKNYANVEKLMVLQYERLVESGTKGLIQNIVDLTGVEAKCDVYPPQDRRKRHIDRELVQYLMKNLDWDAENMLGYFKSGLRSPE